MRWGNRSRVWAWRCCFSPKPEADGGWDKLERVFSDAHHRDTPLPTKVGGDHKHWGLLTSNLESAYSIDQGSVPIFSRRFKKMRVGSAVFLVPGFAALLGIIGLLCYSLHVPAFISGSGKRENEKGYEEGMGRHGSTLKNNGSSDFKRTVLMVSIGSLRADYLDASLTPHLLDMSKKGLCAKSMKPIFPPLTFPNHWALLTGLYAESHGIVANDFWDPVLEDDFHSTKPIANNPSWWLGEPIWETATKAGVLNANLMWPGPPETISKRKPTYFVPYGKMTLKDKLAKIMYWIDLPVATRPQLILAYEPVVDKAGHHDDPDSPQVNEALRQVDGFARDLQKELAERNLTDIVDVIFVSDHGMTDTGDQKKMIFLDDILGAEGLKSLQHLNGWPTRGFHFDTEANSARYLKVLQDAASKDPGMFDVYTSATMPERYHFSALKNKRIAPIYAVPKFGYVVLKKEEVAAGVGTGNHGYDNDESQMRAIFIAHGPFSKNVKNVQATSNDGAGWYSTQNKEYVMDEFQNVEIYGLITRLLGIEKPVAPTNGTEGFWNKYVPAGIQREERLPLHSKSWFVLGQTPLVTIRLNAQ